MMIDQFNIEAIVGDLLPDEAALLLGETGGLSNSRLIAARDGLRDMKLADEIGLWTPLGKAVRMELRQRAAKIEQA